MEKMENAVLKDKTNFSRTISDVMPFFGIILGLLSGCSMGLGIAFAKYLYRVNPFLQLLVRGSLHYAICLSISIYQKHPIIPKTNLRNGILLLISAIVSSLMPMGVLTSIKFISIADSTAIVFTNPAIVAFISALCLGERCSVMQVVAILLSVAGSILVVKPPVIFGESWNSDSSVDIVYGVSLAFGASVFTALSLLSLRKLSTFPWTTLNVHAGCCLIVFSAIAMSMTDIKLPECGTDGLVFVATGLFATGGIVLTVLACKVENPRNVSVSITITVPVVFVCQVLILGTIPSWNTYLGTFLIIVSVLLIWIAKWREMREQMKMNAVNSQLFQKTSL